MCWLLCNFSVFWWKSVLEQHWAELKGHKMEKWARVLFIWRWYIPSSAHSYNWESLSIYNEESPLPRNHISPNELEKYPDSLLEESAWKCFLIQPLDMHLTVMSPRKIWKWIRYTSFPLWVERKICSDLWTESFVFLIAFPRNISPVLVTLTLQYQ